MGTVMSENAYIVQPVLKALRVLEHVAEKGHEVTLTEVAAELKLPKTTVFRYLQTLTAASFLRHDPAATATASVFGFARWRKPTRACSGCERLAQPEMAELGRTLQRDDQPRHPARTAISSISTWSRRTGRCACRRGSATGTRFIRPRSARRCSPSCPRRSSASLLDGSLAGDDGQDGDQPQGPAPPDRGGAPQRLCGRGRERTRKARCASACRSSTRTACPLAALSLAAPERRMTPEITARGDRCLAGGGAARSRSSSARWRRREIAPAMRQDKARKQSIANICGRCFVR